MAAFRKKPNGKIEAIIRRKGHKPRYKVCATMIEAQRWATMIEAQIDYDKQQASSQPVSGTQQASTPKRSVETIHALLDRYEREKTNKKKPRTAAPERRRIARLKSDPVAKLQASDLTPSYLAVFRDERLQQGVMAARHDLQILRHMFNTARREWGVALSDPFADFKFPPAPKERVARVPTDILQRLVQAAQHYQNPYLVPMILLAVFTGMRRSEMLDAKWSDYRAGDSVLLLRDTKNGTDSDLPLTATACSILNELPRTGKHIFPITESNFRTQWTRIVARANLQGLRFHDFRHEAISHFLDQGLTNAQVLAISRHKTLSQLSRYTHMETSKVANLIRDM